MMMKKPVQVFSVQFALIPQIQNNFNKQYRQNTHLRVLVTLLSFIHRDRDMKRKKGAGNEKEERSKFEDKLAAEIEPKEQNYSHVAKMTWLTFYFHLLAALLD